MAKKSLKLPRALKIKRAYGRRGRELKPIPGEDPIVLLRVQVIGCTDLLAKDRGARAIRKFILLTLLTTRFTTPVIKKSLTPTWLRAPRPCCLDKDMIKKDYLGEVSVAVSDWFGKEQERAFGFTDSNNTPFTLPLLSTRSNTAASGSVTLKLGFVYPPNTTVLSEFEETYGELVKRGRPSLVSAPPTEGVGTIRSYSGAPNLLVDDYEDDGGISSDSSSEDSDDEDEEDDFVDAPDELDVLTPIAAPSSSPSTPPKTPNLAITPPSPTFTLSPNQVSTPKVKSPTFMRMKFTRRSSGGSLVSSGTSTPLLRRITSFPSPSLSRKSTTSGEDSGVKGRRERKKKPYSISSPNDIVGIVMLEIKGADDLPRLKNMTRTGWDMDPFVVISFGKKVFRTREKLLFHVRRYETNFKIQLTVLDWDKLSSNDLIGEGALEVGQLIDAFAGDKIDAPVEEGGTDDKEMKEYKVHISTGGSAAWEAMHKPVLTVRAKYQPYAELRRKFWTQYLKQYDTDDTQSLSHIEITSMLDSLGSTLTKTTINKWWERLGKDPHTDELSIGQVVMCLEEELGRPDSEKRMANPDGDEDTSISATPVMMVSDSRGEEIKLDQLNFSGPPMSVIPGEKVETEGIQVPLRPDGTRLPSSETSPAVPGTSPGVPGRRSKIKGRFRRKGKKSKSSESSSSSGSSLGPSLERVINVKNCPLCHRPRLNSKAEMDIITHLAVCASSDWSKVGSIAVSNYVTGAQAQRKWYTRIMGRIGGGDYRLGANSANIIVQDRISGGLEEEKMAVYVRLGIRLLYKGTSRMEGGAARKLLKSLSIKQGVKYDAPESAAGIPAFIEFHGLKVDDILDPLDSFKTFNEFFYRKLKPSARPIEQPENPFRLVSAADCRLMVFESVSEATRLWIKGRDFTVAKLLGDVYKAEAPRYDGGAVAIFRLAPQDYHRFHSAVDGRIGKMEYISGEYYTVNPQAIRTQLDVYGENARKIVPIDSPQFGKVMAVCVGAMMVGTIKTTVDDGEDVRRGQEFGYFAFGGSTIVMLFEPGKVVWDEDLLINGRASLETLVRVGMGIGTGIGSPA
ncbi:hypothetical protein BDZ89DRAFT_1101522 [Hymenopellis radicata]|nr:hypothetical protein BDZ89DRAFT_1101522 [Hymenopellis radicata]